MLTLRSASGFYFRWSDTGWGPVVWLCCLGAQIAVATVVLVLDVPFTSNTESLDSGPVDRGYVIAVLVLAVGPALGSPSALLPVAAGGFVYIAAADLVPELHRARRLSVSLGQIGLMVLGVALVSAPGWLLD